MNKKFLVYLIGTTIQNFVSALYKFGFLLIFYKINNSLVYSSLLSAISIIISKLAMIIIVPYFKNKHPIKISIVMNCLIGIVALLFEFFYNLWNSNITFYFILSILFSSFEGIDNSFHFPIIPKLVQQEYLFKANSINAIFSNINLVVAPLGSYLFYTISGLDVFLFMYSFICFASAFMLYYLIKLLDGNIFEPDKSVEKPNIIGEWKKTLKVIISNNDIFFCICVGVIINLVFSGINGAVLLKMGQIATNEVFGQTVIKIMISVGSLIGVFLVLKLKVKENYNVYINISLCFLILSLVLLAFSKNSIMIYLEFLLLSVFIMFIMNSTGTFLQISAPKNELSSIYVFRATLYAVVVPVSHIIAGIMLEYLNKEYYFMFSAILLLIVLIFKLINKKAILNTN